MSKTQRNFYLDKDLVKRFKAICLEDETSMSRTVEQLIEGYVAKKKEANSMTPLTSWVKGHKDNIKASRPSTLETLKKLADRWGNQLKHKVIMRHLMHIKDGTKRVKESKKIIEQLQKQGVKITY